MQPVMTLAQAEMFCLSWLSAFMGDDPDQLLAYYHRDAFYLDPDFPHGAAGHDALKKAFTMILKKYAGWKIEVQKITLTQNGFRLEWKGIFPTPNGKTIRFGYDIVEIKENKITRNEVYIDQK